MKWMMGDGGFWVGFGDWASVSDDDFIVNLGYRYGF